MSITISLINKKPVLCSVVGRLCNNVVTYSIICLNNQVPAMFPWKTRCLSCEASPFCSVFLYKVPSFSKPRLYWRPRMSAEVEHGTKCYLKPLKSRFVGQHCSLQVADIGESYYGKGMRVCPCDFPHKVG